MYGFETRSRRPTRSPRGLPHRRRPRNLEGLQKNLRHREGRWHSALGPGIRHVGDEEPFVDADELEHLTTELRSRSCLSAGSCRMWSTRTGSSSSSPPFRTPNCRALDAGQHRGGDDNDAFSDAVVEFVTR